MKAGPSQEEVRRRNLGAVLRHVHLGGPASRAALTDRLGLNRSTILALVSELTAVGLVREELPRDTGRAGRPSLVVRPEPERAQVLAVDLGTRHLTAARVGLGGAILARLELPLPARDLTPDRAARTVAEAAHRLADHDAARGTCIGAGVAVHGMVRHPDGLVRSAPTLGWSDAEFGEELTRRLGSRTPVSVGNEANVGALAEHLRGAGAGCTDLVYLYGGVGIGAGVIAGGRLLGGLEGYAGEVGHMVVNPLDGRPCHCGARGCLEAEAGERALLAAARRDTGTAGRDAVLAVVDAADRGDVMARRALQRVGDWLGIGVANLVNLLNPGLVVFGGTLREIYLGSAAQFRSRITTNALAASRAQVRFRVSGLGDDCVLIGAAELAFERLLSSPLETLAGHRAASPPSGAEAPARG